MGDRSNDMILAASAGCAMGFVWSVAAGQADLSEGDGWLRASSGCVGGAANASGIYWVTDQFTSDQDGPRMMSAGWLAAQSAAGFVNWLGIENRWQNNGSYSAVAIPINFAVAPLSSAVVDLYILVTFQWDLFDQGVILQPWANDFAKATMPPERASRIPPLRLHNPAARHETR